MAVDLCCVVAAWLGTVHQSPTIGSPNDNKMNEANEGKKIRQADGCPSPHEVPRHMGVPGALNDMSGLGPEHGYYFTACLRLTVLGWDKEDTQV